jgi:hypothetical protein
MMKRLLFILFVAGTVGWVIPARAADQIIYISQPKEVYIFLNNVAYARDSITLPASVSVKITLPIQAFENTLILREDGKRIAAFRIRRQDAGVSVEWNSTIGQGTREVTLEYLLSGLSWTPNHDMTIGDAKAETVNFNFYAQIQNSVFKLNDVTTHLIAGQVDVSGQVGQVNAASVNQSIAGYRDDNVGTSSSVGATTIQYIYDVGKLSADSGETLYLNLLASDLPARRVLLWNAPSDQQVSVIYKVRNTSTVPLAAGSVRAYQNGIFIGSDPVETTPIGSEGSITVGKLQDVRTNRAESRTAIEGISIYNTQYKVTLKLENFSKDAVEIDVVDQQNPVGEDFTFSAEPSRETGNLLRWTVTIQPGQTQTIEYQYKTR